MKQGLIMTGYNLYGRSIITRYGIEDDLAYIKSTVEDFFHNNDVEYIKIEGNCFVRKFHHEELLKENN